MEKDAKPSASPEVVRWSVNRKKEVVLRMMRGEPIDALSRELGIEAYRLEKWHRKALQGIEAALKARARLRHDRGRVGRRRGQGREPRRRCDPHFLSGHARQPPAIRCSRHSR